jgi:hypothetical protein
VRACTRYAPQLGPHCVLIREKIKKLCTPRAQREGDEIGGGTYASNNCDLGSDTCGEDKVPTNWNERVRWATCGAQMFEELHTMDGQKICRTSGTSGLLIVYWATI